MSADRELELDDPLSVGRLARYDRYAKQLAQPGDTDRYPRLGREVHHVEDEDDGAPQVQYLVDEVQVSLEVRGVDDAEHPVRLRGVEAPAQEHVARHGLVGRASGQRIGPREVDDRYRLAVLG